MIIFYFIFWLQFVYKQATEQEGRRDKYMISMFCFVSSLTGVKDQVSSQNGWPASDLIHTALFHKYGKTPSLSTFEQMPQNLTTLTSLSIVCLQLEIITLNLKEQMLL